jgi:hypothetical protein
MGVKFRWNHKQATIRRLVGNDAVGMFLAETWGTMFNKYVPADKIILANSYRTEPFKVTYYQPYSHYQWYGISRSGRPLNYSHEKHILATSHWEEVAGREKGKEVAQAITNYIKRM